jgi:predicted  nucleic acid-binding Zn-ribbon protein
MNKGIFLTNTSYNQDTILTYIYIYISMHIDIVLLKAHLNDKRTTVRLQQSRIQELETQKEESATLIRSLKQELARKEQEIVQREADMTAREQEIDYHVAQVQSKINVVNTEVQSMF